jgi:tetratricopeptide (TPR) repeat protein
VTQRLIGEYETRLPNEPDNLKLVRSLAELYTQKARFDEALRILRAHQQTGMAGDATLDRAVADTIAAAVRRAHRAIQPVSMPTTPRRWRPSRPRSGIPVGRMRKRTEKYPTDLAIKFELGVLYFKAGKISEATAEFQKAQGNPNKRLAAMSYLAQCFAKRKMFDSAVRKFQNAIKEKIPSSTRKRKTSSTILALCMRRWARRPRPSSNSSSSTNPT